MFHLVTLPSAPAYRRGARALADDIEHWLADEPVSAWPVPVRRWAGRHRTLVSGVAVARGVALLQQGQYAEAELLLWAATRG